MKCIKIVPFKERKWVGTCNVCDSEFEAVTEELSIQQRPSFHGPRDYAQKLCPECFLGFITFYAKKNTKWVRHETIN